MKFGRQVHPTLGTTFVSNGIVIATEEQPSVLAVADGKVLYAGEFMSYGAMTVVEHPGDWYTVYGHLTHWIVEKGQEIKKGDSVGVGRPRQGGGFEAYFELRFYGKPTDPIPWLQP
jgi:septal ring factor EnvC (AmiA/AmiB activator)